MSRLTRDGTAEPVSRDQILRRERGQGNIHFPCQLTTSRIGNLTRLIHTLAICDDHTCIHMYILLSLKFQVSSVFYLVQIHKENLPEVACMYVLRDLYYTTPSIP